MSLTLVVKCTKEEIDMLIKPKVQKNIEVKGKMGEAITTTITFTRPLTTDQ